MKHTIVRWVGDHAGPRLEAGDDDEVAAAGEDVLMRGALLVLRLALLVAGCGSDPSSFDSSGEELKDAGTSRDRVEARAGIDRTLVRPRPARGRSTTRTDRGEARRRRVASERKKSRSEMRAIFIGRDSYIGRALSRKDALAEAVRLRGHRSGSLRAGAWWTETGRGSRPLGQVEQERREARERRDPRRQCRPLPCALDGRRWRRSTLWPKGLVIDAWIDGDGLLRRIRIPSGGTEGPAESSTCTTSAYRSTSRPPPADEVVSEEEAQTSSMDEGMRVADKDREDENAWCLAVRRSDLVSGRRQC